MRPAAQAHQQPGQQQDDDAQQLLRQMQPFGNCFGIYVVSCVVSEWGAQSASQQQDRAGTAIASFSIAIVLPPHSSRMAFCRKNP